MHCTSQIHNTVHVGHIHEGNTHKRTQSLDTGGRSHSISASFRTFGPMFVVFLGRGRSFLLHCMHHRSMYVASAIVALLSILIVLVERSSPWFDDPTEQVWSVGFVRPLRSYFMGGFLSPSARNRSASFPERGMFFNHRTVPFHRHTAFVRSVHAPVQAAAIVHISFVCWTTRRGRRFVRPLVSLSLPVSPSKLRFKFTGLTGTEGARNRCRWDEKQTPKDPALMLTRRLI